MAGYKAFVVWVVLNQTAIAVAVANVCVVKF